MDKSYRKILVLVSFSALIIIAMIIVNQLTTKRHGKVIQVTIIDDKQEVVYDEKVDTTQNELKGLLDELKTDKAIQLQYNQDNKGNEVVGLGEKEMLMNDESTNKVWKFSSDNNIQCQTNGVCESVEKQTVEDGDVFIFRLQQE